MKTPSAKELTAYYETVRSPLAECGISLAPGLTDDECSAVETAFQFRFPEDLKSFLKWSLPIGDHVPNWRGPPSQINDFLSWPEKSISFDVENGVWLDSWGARPAEVADGLRIIREAMAKAPRLVPIFKHRYLPSEPIEAGNPVLSVYQTDIIHYASDLAGYLKAEFRVPLPWWSRTEPRPIRFWDELILENNRRV